MATQSPRSSPSSRAGARIGEQEPRVRVESGEVAYTDGRDAADLIADLGMDLFDWQRDVLDAWCARDEEDRPAYSTCGTSVPRQNGKNADLEAYEVYQMAVCGAHILHTAHRVKTAKKSFNRLVKYFTDERHHPELAQLAKKANGGNIRYTNGEEAITLSNGASIEFSARSRSVARGYDDIQVLVFDEAQDLTDDQQAAILYTLAASSTGDRQIIFTGTPPDPKSPGTVFRRVRKAALSETPSKKTCWHEWGVEELPPRDATYEDVLDLIYETNPSMGLTLDEEWTENEFDQSDPLDFARERLGWWDPDIEAADPPAIDREVWERTSIESIGKRYQGIRALGVKFSPDGTSWALAGCKARRDRSRYAFELVELARRGNRSAQGHDVGRLRRRRGRRRRAVREPRRDGAAARLHREDEGLRRGRRVADARRRARRRVSVPRVGGRAVRSRHVR